MLKDLKNKPRNFSGAQNHMLDDVESKKQGTLFNTSLEHSLKQIAKSVEQFDNGEGISAHEAFAIIEAHRKLD